MCFFVMFQWADRVDLRQTGSGQFCVSGTDISEYQMNESGFNIQKIDIQKK